MSRGRLAWSGPKKHCSSARTKEECAGERKSCRRLASCGALTTMKTTNAARCLPRASARQNGARRGGGAHPIGVHDRLLLSLAASSRADEAAEAACGCLGSSGPIADADDACSHAELALWSIDRTPRVIQ